MTDTELLAQHEHRLRQKVSRRHDQIERDRTRREYLSYGYGSHQEPLDFLPDLDMVSPGERERWVQACLQQEAHKAVDRSVVDHITTRDEQGRMTAHISLSGWGIGVGYYRALADADVADMATREAAK